VLKDKLLLTLKDTATKDLSFKDLVQEAGLQTDWAIVDQLVADQDGRVTWEDFYAKLKEKPAVVVEDETSAKSTCC